MESKLASDLKSFCLSLWRAGITGVHRGWLLLKLLSRYLDVHIPKEIGL